MTTLAYDSARRVIGDFLGADPDRDVVVFTKNTTEAINKLARSLPVADGDVDGVRVGSVECHRRHPAR